MAGLRPETPQPSSITVHEQSRQLEVGFFRRTDLPHPVRIDARLFAVGRSGGPRPRPGSAADRQARGAAHRARAVGNYAVQPTFSDGHDSGIYSWDYLYHLGAQQDELWQRYEARLRRRASTARHGHGPPAASSCGHHHQHPESAAMSEPISDSRPSTRRRRPQRVRGVFDSVASKYDVMNDLDVAGPAPRLEGLHGGGGQPAHEGDRVLDLAGGTGDLHAPFARKVGDKGLVVHTDINEAMLRRGRDRLLDEGLVLPTTICATPRCCRSRAAASISSASPSACAT